MDFINQAVSHKRFGAGKVMAFDGKTVTVRFEEFGERAFVYPDAFESFLQTENPGLSGEIALDIANKRAETEQAARKAAEERAIAAAVLAASTPPKKSASRSAKKPAVKLAIKPSKPKAKPKSKPGDTADA